MSVTVKILLTTYGIVLGLGLLTFPLMSIYALYQDGQENIERRKDLQEACVSLAKEGTTPHNSLWIQQTWSGWDIEVTLENTTRTCKITDPNHEWTWPQTLSTSQS